jgi:tRNA 2-selenouridine synthase
VLLSAHAALNLLTAPLPAETSSSPGRPKPSEKTPSKRPAFIDVRSEKEFADGSVPGFENLPILTQAERHEVGTAYKRQGQERAIALGHQLTAPHREARVTAWVQRLLASESRTAIVMCWRGGLRSRIATEWIAEALTQKNAGSFAAARVEGGYQALRRLLLRECGLPRPLLVLMGSTGSGKTRFLSEASERGIAGIDLEALAHHRGSSFGRSWDYAQPSQSRFENSLGLALRSAVHRTEPEAKGRDSAPTESLPEILVEDESVCIGSLHVPRAFFEGMREAPAIVLRASLEERAATIHFEYVEKPLQAGHSPERVLTRLEGDLLALARRLGGLETRRLTEALRKAFESAGGAEAHYDWISSLLTRYYDPMYAYGKKRHPRRIIFEGDRAACLEFLLDRRLRNPPGHERPSENPQT